MTPACITVPLSIKYSVGTVSVWVFRTVGHVRVVFAHASFRVAHRATSLASFQGWRVRVMKYVRCFSVGKGAVTMDHNMDGQT